MSWRTLFNRQVVFDSIEMSDWEMFVEQSRGRPAQLSRAFPLDAGGPRRGSRP